MREQTPLSVLVSLAENGVCSHRSLAPRTLGVLSFRIYHKQMSAWYQNRNYVPYCLFVESKKNPRLPLDCVCCCWQRKKKLQVFLYCIVVTMTSIIYYFRSCSHLTHENHYTGSRFWLFAHNNGDFGAISVTARCCAKRVGSHISDRSLYRIDTKSYPVKCEHSL